jgi:hypothetical protein
MRVICALIAVALLIGCEDATRRSTRPLPDTGTAPTPIPPIPEPNKFEFRVLGDPDTLARADIRWSTSQEGTSVTASQLPWTTTVRTLDSSSFLTLSARQTTLGITGFLHIQIVVNGRVFREASAPGPEASVSVSGTFAQ